MKHKDNMLRITKKCYEKLYSLKIRILSYTGRYEWCLATINEIKFVLKKKKKAPSKYGMITDLLKDLTKKKMLQRISRASGIQKRNRP